LDVKLFPSRSTLWKEVDFREKSGYMGDTQTCQREIYVYLRQRDTAVLTIVYSHNFKDYRLHYSKMAGD